MLPMCTQRTLCHISTRERVLSFLLSLMDLSEELYIARTAHVALERLPQGGFPFTEFILLQRLERCETWTVSVDAVVPAAVFPTSALTAPRALPLSAAK